MVLAAVNAKPHGLALMLGWRCVLLTLGVSVLLGLLNTVPSSSPTSSRQFLFRRLLKKRKVMRK